MTPIDRSALAVLRLIAKHPALYGETPEDLNGLVLGVASTLLALHCDPIQLDFRDAYRVRDNVLNVGVDRKQRRSRLGDYWEVDSLQSSMDIFSVNCDLFIDQLETVLSEYDTSHKADSAGPS